MSWRYNSNNIRQALTDGKIENFHEKTNNNHHENKHIPKTNAKIKYDSFEAKCNLEYVVTPTGVKENIILNSYSGKNKFSFEVTARDLEFIKNEDKSITVVNQNEEEIFFIPAPFMYDADNQYCYDVDYSIENKNGKYIISVVADEEWLKDKERKYPVTIDPIIETEKNTSAIETTFVASGTLCTSASLSNADTSGSCGCAVRGSRKKTIRSSSPFASIAPICWSPPLGPLFIRVILSPVSPIINVPVVPVAYNSYFASTS